MQESTLVFLPSAQVSKDIFNSVLNKTCWGNPYIIQSELNIDKKYKCKYKILKTL